MKLLAMTCCCVDVYPHSGEIHPGGNALNIVADWALQGKRILSHPSCRDREMAIRLLGATGADEYGACIRKSIAMLPIDADSLHVIDDVTANHRICIDENGDRYFEQDAWLAAFLLATQAGLEPEEAMREGANAAAVVIRHPGGFQIP